MWSSSPAPSQIGPPILHCLTLTPPLPHPPFPSQTDPSRILDGLAAIQLLQGKPHSTPTCTVINSKTVSISGFYSSAQDTQQFIDSMSSNSALFLSFMQVSKGERAPRRGEGRGGEEMG